MWYAALVLIGVTFCFRIEFIRHRLFKKYCVVEPPGPVHALGADWHIGFFDVQINQDSWC